MRWILLLGMTFALAGCLDEEEKTTDAPIRGLKTHLLADTQRATMRRFPSVLEPTSLNVLAFDTSGKLLAVNLQVGQRVDAGEVLARLDPIRGPVIADEPDHRFCGQSRSDWTKYALAFLRISLA